MEESSTPEIQKTTTNTEKKQSSPMLPKFVFILVNIILTTAITYFVASYVIQKNLQNSDTLENQVDAADVINPVDSTLYINTKQLYQIRYPLGWYVIPVMNDPQQRVVEFSTHYVDKNNFEADGKYFVVSVQNSTPDLELLFKQKPQSKIPDSSLAKVADLSIDGKPAVEAVRQNDKVYGSSGDELRQEDSYFIKDGSKIYVIDFIQFDKAIIPPHFRLYRQVAKSFKKI